MSPAAGHLDIHLEIRDGRVAAVRMANHRPQADRLLCGRRADEIVRLVPALFALCGHAQGKAARLALAGARGTGTPRHLDATVLAEALREHLWRLLLDLPPLLGLPPLKDEFAAAVAWLARDERAPIAALLDDERIAALAQRLDGLPDGEDAAARFLPPLDADASRKAWPRLDAAFCVQPDWLGEAAETGALARRGGAAGGACAQRWRARLAELHDWAGGAAKVGAGGTASSTSVAPGSGRALVETARGLLMHEIVLDGDSVADYFIVAPTEWNFHPRGPLPRWLLGRDASDREALGSLVARCVAALDPCVRWELDWL